MIRSKPATKEYRENYDRIFGKNKKCSLCGRAHPAHHACTPAMDKQKKQKK